MATATLSIDLDALADNWRALDAASSTGTTTAATIKANAYGLGLAPAARTLAAVGARSFFVAIAEEGAALRDILGPGPEIYVYSGHMPGDAGLIAGKDLLPLLNSVEQLTRHLEALPDCPFGIQLDTGMNRLGMEPAEWAAVAELALQRHPRLLQSHLACADEPGHPMNARQLALFRQLTDGLGIARSIAATGGILLGPEYHFEMARPGIGLYGGAPFTEARPVVHLSIPVIQVRELDPAETVGYGCTWTADGTCRIATLAAGYADGILRAMGNRAALWHGQIACPLRGRVSMDLLTADVSHLDAVPASLDLLGPQQGIDAMAEAAGTIGYEILTALGPRYTRRYRGGSA
jgi:alanine racemase